MNTYLPISCSSLSRHVVDAAKLTDEMSAVKPAESKTSGTEMFVVEKFAICRVDVVIKVAFVTFQMSPLKD